MYIFFTLLKIGLATKGSTNVLFINCLNDHSQEHQMIYVYSDEKQKFHRCMTLYK